MGRRSRKRQKLKKGGTALDASRKRERFDLVGGGTADEGSPLPVLSLTEEKASVRGIKSKQTIK